MPIFIDLAIFREVDGIHLLAILKKYWNKLASLKRSSNTQIFNSFGFKIRSAIADSYSNHILKSSQKIAMLFPTAAACIILHSNLPYKRVPISLHSWCLLCSFVFVLCEVVFHWGSGLHSCTFNHIESFVLFINYLLIFSKDMVIQVLQSVLNRFFVLLSFKNSINFLSKFLDNFEYFLCSWIFHAIKVASGKNFCTKFSLSSLFSERLTDTLTLSICIYYFFYKFM